MVATTALIEQHAQGLQRLIDEYQRGESILRPRQLAVMQAEVDRLLSDAPLEAKRTSYLKIPTGVGKTIMFLKSLEADFAVAEPMEVVITVPSKRLVEQTGEKIDEFTPDLDYGLVYQRAKQFGHKVTITTYDSLLIQINNGNINPESVGMLVLDEGHIVLGPQRSGIPALFKNAIIRAWTATPEYDEEKSLRALFGEPIYEMLIREAVENGLSSSFKNVLIHTDAEVDFDALSYARSYGQDDYNQRELQRALDIEAIRRDVVQQYFTFRDPETGETLFGQPIRVNNFGIEDAKAQAALFSQALAGHVPEGIIPAVAIHHELSDGERSEIDRLRMAGKIWVTCQVNTLNLGDDQTNLKACFNNAPTMSAVRAEQRGGRVTRLHPQYPGMMKYVFDYVFRSTSLNAPILFAQVAGGAQILNPATKDTEPSIELGIPRPRVHFDFPAFDVTSRLSEVAAFIHNHEKVRDNAHIPPRDDEWLSALEAALAIGLTRSNFDRVLNAFRRLNEKAVADSTTQIQINEDGEKRNIVDLIGYRRSRGKAHLFCHPDLLFHLEAVLEPNMPDKGTWWSCYDIKHNTPFIKMRLARKVLNFLKERLTEDEEASIEVEGDEVFIADVLEMRRSVSNKTLCVNPEIAPWIHEYFGIAEGMVEQGNWISIRSVARKLNVRQVTISRAIAQLFSDLQQNPDLTLEYKDSQENTVTVKASEVVQKRWGLKGPALCCNPDHIGAIAELLGLGDLEAIQEGWNTRYSVAEKRGVNFSSVNNLCNKILRDAGGDENAELVIPARDDETPSVTIKVSDAVRTMRVQQKPSLCIADAAMPYFELYLSSAEKGNWYSVGADYIQFNTTKAVFRRALNSLFEPCIENANATLDVPMADGTTTTHRIRDVIQFRRSGIHTVLCFDPQIAPLVQERIAASRKKGGVKPKGDIGDMNKRHYVDPAMFKLWNDRGMSI